MLGILGTGAGALIIVAGILSLYKKCGSDEVLVRTGLGGNKILTGGGAIVFPILQEHHYLRLTPYNLDINLNKESGVVSSDKIRVIIEADATFAISQNESERKIASERLIHMDDREKENLAKEILTGQLRSIVSEMTFEELLQDRKKLMSKVSESTEKALNSFGLDLMNFNIKMIKDLDGIIEQLGKKASAIATTGAKIATAEQEKNSAIQVAELETQREINISKTNSDRAGKVAEYDIAKANSESTKKFETSKAQSNAQKEIDAIDIENQKLIKLKEIKADKEVNIEEQLVKQSIAEQEKETTVKLGELELEKQRLEEVVDTKIENEKRELDTDTNLRIERKTAENNLLIAQTKAEAIVTEAEASAKAMKLKAEGEAAILSKPLIEKAKAEKALMDVYGQENLIKLKFIEILPELAKYQAEAVKGIEIDSINVISGGGEGSTGAVGNEIGNTVANIVKSIPAFKMANDLAESINLPKLHLAGNQVEGESIKEFVSPLIVEPTPEKPNHKNHKNRK